jgi:hypothetical protein
MAYDIFISYRRKGSGAGVAGELQAKLTNKGYNVFLDVDEIVSGTFPEQIDHAIKECSDFLLILSPGTLDRCIDESDWVRHEIMLAEKYGKNIVGVSLPGFVMPLAESLPAELHEIPEKQVFLWSHEYRQASFEKIVENLISTKLKKKRAKRNLSWMGIFVAVLALGGWWLLNMTDEQQPAVVEEKKNTNDYQYFTDAVKDTFATYLRTADSLLQLVPNNPAEKQDFDHFMESIAQYDDALRYERKYPGVISSAVRVEKKRDSLMVIRQQRLNRELEAANKFLEVDRVDFARFRYENAQVLALPEESDQLEIVGKKLSKVM